MKNRLTKAIIGLFLIICSTLVLIWMYHGLMLNQEMQDSKAYIFLSENPKIFSAGTFALHALVFIGLFMLFIYGIKAIKERKR